MHVCIYFSGMHASIHACMFNVCISAYKTMHVHICMYVYVCIYASACVLVCERVSIEESLLFSGNLVLQVVGRPSRHLTPHTIYHLPWTVSAYTHTCTHIHAYNYIYECIDLHIFLFCYVFTYLSIFLLIHVSHHIN